MTISADQKELRIERGAAPARRPRARPARRGAARPRRRRLQSLQRRASRRLGTLPAQPARPALERGPGRRHRPGRRPGQDAGGRHAVEPTAMFIHGAIHRLGGKACVLHTHMPYATALTLTADRCLDTTLSQNAMRFHGRVAVDARYNGLALDASEGERIARRWARPTSSSSATTASSSAASAWRTPTTTSTTSSAPAWPRCWRSRPAGRWFPSRHRSPSACATRRWASGCSPSCSSRRFDAAPARAREVIDR